MSTATTARTATTAPPRGTALAALVMRLAAGAVLLVHGIPKLDGVAGVQQMAAGLGVPAPEVAGWLVVAGEVGLGVLLLLGLLTRLAGALVAVQMLLIFALVHAPDGVLTPTGLDGENAVLLAVLGAALALTGAGALSVDAARTRS